MPRVATGPVNIITLTSPSEKYRWISSSSGVRYVDVSDRGFREVAAMDAPGVQPIPPQALDEVLDQTFTDTARIQSAIRDDWGGATWQRIANGVNGLVDNRVSARGAPRSAFPRASSAST